MGFLAGNLEWVSQMTLVGDLDGYGFLGWVTWTGFLGG